MTAKIETEVKKDGRKIFVVNFYKKNNLASWFVFRNIFEAMDYAASEVGFDKIVY